MVDADSDRVPDAGSGLDLTIIFVNWNALEYLRECIASIYEYTTGIDFEIIVVDNASSKGDVDALTALFPRIILIKSRENLGFARANNLGSQQARGALLLFLNPDTRLVGPAINVLVERMEALRDSGIAGCRLVNPDLSVQTTSIQKFPTIMRQVLNVEYLRLRWPGCPLWDIAPLFRENRMPIVVEVIPGACMLIRREVFERVGGFSEEYFMYAEDVDLNLKVARAGLKSYYVSDSVVVHYGGISSAQKGTNQWSTMMIYRAMQQYFCKNRSHAYATSYKVSMGVCAFARLAILVGAFPFGSILWNRRAICKSMKKWWSVLRWSLGLWEMTP